MAKPQAYRFLSDGGKSEAQPPRNYYLWSYQPYFLTSVQTAADGLFRKLDPTIEPDVCLVAIKIGEADQHPAAVVEPEDHDLTPSDFSNVLALTEEFQKASPGPQYGWSCGSTSGEMWAAQEMRRDFLGNISRT